MPLWRKQIDPTSKKKEDNMRGSIKASVPLRPNISCVSHYETLKRWKGPCVVYGWQKTQQWLSVGGAVVREKAMRVKVG
jgi:hypothetical protein